MTDTSSASKAVSTESTEAETGPALKVAIIAGGLGHERDVSLRSGRRIAQTLIDQGFTVRVWDLDPQLVSHLQEWEPDVVWPLVHGADGENGALQDLLRVLQIPYVGADGACSRLASSKPAAKALLTDAGIATPVWVTFSQSLFRQVGAKAVLDVVIQDVGLPLVVKPTKGGSALGVSIVRDAADLPEAMVNCFAYGNEALLERYVEGTEVAVSVVDLDAGPRVLPAVEIVAEDVYDFDARYNAGRAEFFVPARLDDDARGRVENVAREVHEMFSLREVSRIDMIVDGEGTPWVLDINVAPGMTETSLFPQAATAAGPELYAAIVRAAAEGEGDVVGVDNADEASTVGGSSESAAGPQAIAHAILSELSPAERAPFVIEGADSAPGLGASDNDEDGGTGTGAVGFAAAPRVIRGSEMPETDLPACPECGGTKTHHLVFGFTAEPGQANTIYGGQLVPSPGPWPNLQCVVCGWRWFDESLQDG